MLMHDYGGGEGSSHDVDIILRRGLLNDDPWLQRGAGGLKIWEKVIM